MLEPGRIVGEYRVEGAIGVGSSGEVYRVRHAARGTVHALKYLPLPSRKVRDRMLREAQLQTRLSHPNVVTLTEVIEIDGDPALVMEYVDGPNLSAWLAAGRPTVREAEALFRGIVAGVAHAHRKNLIHRDLKPANVLLARTPQGLVPKVADFGVAKMLDSSAPALTGAPTQGGVGLGTPAYMAPEQIRDARSVDAAADMWALGCILYEMLCFQRAFQGADLLAVLNAAQAGRYTNPRAIVSGLPDPLVRAIEMCLVPDRERRLDSCESLLDVLGDSGPLGPVSSSGRHTDPPRLAPEPPAGLDERQQMAFAAAAGGGVALAIGAALLLAWWAVG